MENFRGTYDWNEGKWVCNVEKRIFRLYSQLVMHRKCKVMHRGFTFSCSRNIKVEGENYVCGALFKTSAARDEHTREDNLHSEPIPEADPEPIPEEDPEEEME